MAFGDILGGLIQGGAPILGSVAGPAGAAIGGLAGQAGGDLARWAFKKPNQQEQQLAQLMQQMGSPYQFQKVDFNPIAQAEQRRFQQEVIPGIAERFTGSGGGQRSSAFRNALGGAGTDLASRLAELRASHDVGQQQAGMQAYGLNQQRMGSLANLLQGQQQQQQAAREAQMNRYAQFAGALPKTMLDRQRLSLDAQRLGQQEEQNWLNNIIAGLGENRANRSDIFNQLGQLSNVAQGQGFDVERNRIPSGWERAGNIYGNVQNKANQTFINALKSLMV